MEATKYLKLILKRSARSGFSYLSYVIFYFVTPCNYRADSVVKYHDMLDHTLNQHIRI